MNKTTTFLLATLMVTTATAQDQRAARPRSAKPRVATPAGNGQLETPPALFKAGVDDQGREFLLNGQPSKNGKLILTASNGFFDNKTCRAGGESSLPKVGDDALIKPNFAYLGDWRQTNGAARWHLWLPRAGKIRLNVNMQVAQSAAGSELVVSFAGQSQNVTTIASAPGKSQPWNLVFDAVEPGEHTISISASKIADPKSGIGQLHTIDVYGPAIHKAQLLRARWRPAAVHGGYSCSTLEQSQMWVMTTRSVCDFSSYSPITTPFGYYGTSFDPDRRARGSFNFSMWAASAKAKTPPLHQMPHLLAAGSRDAEFSGFGHEGSGVKLRGWTPMPDRPQVCVQALRVENDGDYDTYHGYFWDHPASKWKLYAVGRKWNGGKPKTNLMPGSFCEIPGPPNVQRSGDMVREVRRRGWHYGDDKQWYAMDTFRCKQKEPANKFWYTTPDREFAMGTGGMRHYQFKQPAEPENQNGLPAFLSSQATEQLYALPAEFADLRPAKVSSSFAELNLRMVRAGTNASATIYFGETDCLTFAKRKLHGTERNSDVSKSTQAGNRSWSHSIKIDSVQDGNNLVKLDKLQPNTKYFCRALVVNDEGQIWTFESQSFLTK